jgi:hypothetical protein
MQKNVVLTRVKFRKRQYRQSPICISGYEQRLDFGLLICAFLLKTMYDIQLIIRKAGLAVLSASPYESSHSGWSGDSNEFIWTFHCDGFETTTPDR